jgi:hypothetical protein
MKALEKFNKWIVPFLVIGLVVFFAMSYFGGPEIQQGVSNFNSITLSDDLIVGDDATVTDDLTVTGLATIGETLEITGVTTFTAGISQAVNVESVMYPTVLSVDIDIDNDSSPFTCATVADGEIWFVHEVFANVLDNFDTGGSNDATFDVGDGNDQDGFLDLDDGELQVADTEGTGATAAWQGFMSTDTRGVYMASTPTFPYAPSGAAETIDCTFAGTGLASDTGDTATDITVYVVYTRIQ